MPGILEQQSDKALDLVDTNQSLKADLESAVTFAEGLIKQNEDLQRLLAAANDKVLEDTRGRDDRIEGLMEELQKLRTEHSRLQVLLDLANAQLSEDPKVIEQKDERIQQLEQQIVVVQRIQHNLTRENDNYLEQIALLEQKQGQLKAEKQKIEQGYHSRSIQLHQELTQREAEVGKLQQSLDLLAADIASKDRLIVNLKEKPEQDRPEQDRLEQDRLEQDRPVIFEPAQKLTKPTQANLRRLGEIQDQEKTQTRQTLEALRGELATLQIQNKQLQEEQKTLESKLQVANARMQARARAMAEYSTSATLSEQAKPVFQIALSILEEQRTEIAGLQQVVQQQAEIIRAHQLASPLSPSPASSDIPVPAIVAKSRVEDSHVVSAITEHSESCPSSEPRLESERSRTTMPLYKTTVENSNNNDGWYEFETMAYNPDKYYLKKTSSLNPNANINTNTNTEITAKVERQEESYSNKPQLALEVLLSTYLASFSNCKPGYLPSVYASGGDPELVALFYAYAQLFKTAGLPIMITGNIPGDDNLTQAKDRIKQLFLGHDSNNNNDKDLGRKIINLNFGPKEVDQAEPELRRVLQNLGYQERNLNQKYETVKQSGLYNTYISQSHQGGSKYSELGISQMVSHDNTDYISFLASCLKSTTQSTRRRCLKAC